MDKEAITKIRNDFPILKQKINGNRLAYLDNAATMQMPVPILHKINSFYQTSYANVHRSVDTLGFNATKQYEEARGKVASFINAADANDIIFTSGCTDSLNLVAATYGEQNIHEQDEIVLTIMEHHSNLLPWQQLAKRKGAILKYIDLTESQTLDLDDVKKKITAKTKIVAIAHASNILGMMNPIDEVIKIAHQAGAVVVVDGAQAVSHFPVDVQKIDADFYAFSGHKMLAPTGIGVLYGKKQLLDQMTPYRFGGEMISNVTKYDATWADLPQKFEAGTPNIVGAIGLGYAIDYLHEIGMNRIQTYENELSKYLMQKIEKLDFVAIYGPKEDHTGVFSFNLKNIHPHDVATALDMQGIEVRAGHHCAQPLMHRLGVESTVKASLSFYNNKEDIDQLIAGISETEEFFNGTK